MLTYGRQFKTRERTHARSCDGSALEEKLQGQLNQPGIARGLRKTPGAIGVKVVHRATALARLEVDGVIGSWIIEQKLPRVRLWIDVVPDVKELRAKFESVTLVQRDVLENGKIPVLKARPADDVAPGISERACHRIRGEGACVE
jgi:hypothetical protein